MKKENRIFICDNIKGHYIGGVAIIIAPNVSIARTMLAVKLDKADLPQEWKLILREYSIDVPIIDLLKDGDY